MTDAEQIKYLRAENDRLIAEIVLLSRVEANLRRFEVAIRRIDELAAEIKELKEKERD